MSRSKTDPAALKPATRLVTAARAFTEHGMVNPAVYHASTILFPSVEELHARRQPYLYGRRGTPTSRAFEEAVATLEGAHDARVTPSGMAAVSTALLAFLKSGDHLLMVDTAYHPTRQFCDGLLAGLGIETEYYDPLIGKDIGRLIRRNTRIVYCESPGSQTMEVQDIPAIAAEAHAKGALVLVDNTWATGHLFNVFDHGGDVSIQAATKYIVGHSDAMLGAVACSARAWPQFAEAYGALGQFAGPDDIYLGLRGMRTLDVRLERHMRNALEIARWLADRPEVARVLYPALPGDAGHALWRRDFRGASGLFSVALKPASDAALAAMLDNLVLFGMGYSWGGYESLVVPFRPHRTATAWQETGPCLRFHVGLEDPADLIADLTRGFERLRAAS